MWAATGVIIYSGIELGGVDSVAAVRALDAQFGTDMASHINPSAGNLAVAIAVNEIIEPVRLPIAIATTPTVVRMFRKFTRK